MKSKTPLLCSVALGVVCALSVGDLAQAASAHKRPARARASAAATAAEVQALRAEVKALEARLEAQAQAQQAAQAQLAQTQSQVAQTQSQVAQTQTQVQQVAADAESAQEKLNDVPTQVLATVAELPKPKPSWADSTTISGRMYYDLTSISQKSNGVKVPPSGVGFDIKRFYLGVDHRFNDTYSANLTTDVQYSSALSATHLMIKKAYLQASYADYLNIRLGANDTPWIPFVEDLYGFRYVEQTLAERPKFGASADWGVHVYGKLGPIVSYQVSVVDGGGYKVPLRSKTMDVEGRVSAKYHDFTVAVGGYTGRLGKKTEGAVNVFHTASRFDALAAYVHGPVRLGVEYFSAKNWNNVTTVAQDRADGVGAFGSYAVNGAWTVFGRYDHVKPAKTTAPRRKENYFNLGLQYEPVKIVDLSLVYKRDKLENGTLNTANGVIGGSIDGTYDEVGLFGQVRW